MVRRDGVKKEDKLMAGLFGDMFDLNNDGELDSLERALEYQFMDDLIDEEEQKERMEDLELSVDDILELEMMDEEERRAAIEEAGLDPDDYDFMDW